MEFSWDAVGALAEMLGAIAVLVTVVYLATQIKQTMKRSSKREIVFTQPGPFAAIYKTEFHALRITALWRTADLLSLVLCIAASGQWQTNWSYLKQAEITQYSQARLIDACKLHDYILD